MTHKSKILIGALALGAVFTYLFILNTGDSVRLHLDVEDKDSYGKIINPATQSLNRYSAVVNKFGNIKSIQKSENSSQYDIQLSSDDPNHTIQFKNIDFYQLVPILPYETKPTLDAFDKANLMLGEFSRNGIAFSYQENNSELGYFNDYPNPFFSTDDTEYEFGERQVQANIYVRPERFSITNNCLKAGLWELAATDAVGEMYHAWFKFPKDKYFTAIRDVNGFDIPSSQLAKALKYKRSFKDTKIDLERLRKLNTEAYSGSAKIIASKTIGGYSTQDSRRKSQQKFFYVMRDGKEINPTTFKDLRIGDVFSMRKFVNPGKYSKNKKKEVYFDPYWSEVSINRVEPLTQYKGGKSAQDLNDKYLEIIIGNTKSGEEVILGNIPVSLLVEKDDYLITAFGVGIFPPSELAERRHLRIKQGPPPHYAYQVKNKNGEKYLLNNHEGGIEQVALRVNFRDNKVFLKVTFIAYERIIDLLEFEVEIEGDLKQDLIESSENFKQPLFRVYEDNNVL